MIERTTLSLTDRRRLMISGISLILALLLVWEFAASHNGRPLKPIRPAETAELLPISNEAAFVTFSELNADPAAYQNQFIRVSGRFNPLIPPACQPYNGPRIYWSLLSEDLQLDGIGFEAILREVPADTILTVQGIWRQYEGPYGCGKQPPTNVAWYLELIQIIEPNPLFGADAIALNTILGNPTPVEEGESTPTAVVIEPTATEGLETPLAVTATPTPTPSLLTTATGTVTATPTLFGTPTATTTPGTATATLTPTATPTLGTVVPGTPTETVTPTPTLNSVPPTPNPDPYQGTTPVPTLPGATPLPTSYP